ncbi:MAG: T9SS type A sorting domain-containing protein [Bacteroidales bacterium]
MPSNTMHISISGISEFATNNTINVYPNPVHDELILEALGNKEKLNVEIMNAIGKVVYRGKLIEKTIVETSDFSPGIYLIKLGNAKSFEFKKIVKE